MSGATIGQHTRHFIEFFQCLLQQAPSGVLNYDLRRRNPAIENSPQAALAAIEDIQAAILHLDLSQELRLEGDLNGPFFVSTNTGRELLYNLEHCIHHLAIIKIGLAILKPQLTLSEHFGLAASTAKHRKGQLRDSN